MFFWIKLCLNKVNYWTVYECLSAKLYSFHSYRLLLNFFVFVFVDCVMLNIILFILIVCYGILLFGLNSILFKSISLSIIQKCCTEIQQAELILVFLGTLLFLFYCLLFVLFCAQRALAKLVAAMPRGRDASTLKQTCIKVIARNFERLWAQHFDRQFGDIPRLLHVIGPFDDLRKWHVILFLFFCFLIAKHITVGRLFL